jgi:hypothetical protein
MEQPLWKFLIVLQDDVCHHGQRTVIPTDSVGGVWRLKLLPRVVSSDLPSDICRPII